MVIRNDRTLTSTSPHEIGHCLNLIHTHETVLGIENPNGSNCLTAGDLVCDTPADPKLGTNNVNNNCKYTGGNVYNPLTNNIMSYFRAPCRNEITNKQGLRARDAILNKPILQNIISNSCEIDLSGITISEINNLCYSESKTVTLSNVGNATVSWTSSDNVYIVSSNNSSAVIRAENSTATGNGWIRTIVDNETIFQKDFRAQDKKLWGN